MKKLLVLALVLCMATMANAALKIAVNGVIDGTVTLTASQTATISIYSDSVIGFGNGDWNGLGLVAPTALGTITGGVVAPAYAEGGTLAEPGLSIQGTIEGAGMPAIPGYEGMGMTLNVTGSNIQTGQLLFDLFTFHCEGPGDVVIQLLGTQQYDVWSPALSSVTIHQVIPEPMTMGLLGLGGLFLRRRSK